MRPRNPEHTTTRAGRRSPCRKQGEVAAVAAAVAPTHACPADTVAYALRGAPDGELRGRLMRRRNASETGRQNRSSITCPRPALDLHSAPWHAHQSRQQTLAIQSQFAPHWPAFTLSHIGRVALALILQCACHAIPPPRGMLNPNPSSRQSLTFSSQVLLPSPQTSGDDINSRIRAQAHIPTLRSQLLRPSKLIPVPCRTQPLRQYCSRWWRTLRTSARARTHARTHTCMQLLPCRCSLCHGL